jgi:rare lipoprotein A
MTASTAAHPDLPFGSMVRLINTRNGRSAVVRINDRGPFVDGRNIDVSYHAAEKLGILDRGVAKVRMELLEVPKRH